jgi:sugar transferase (PEP-CTERM/EpsH1 system associated)
LNILVIDEEFPYPLNTGKRIRSFSLTRALTRHNSVSYLAYGFEKSESFRHLESNGIQCYAVDPPDHRQDGLGFFCRLGLNLFSPLPYIVTNHHSRRFAARLKELIAQERYDLVICEWTPYAIFLKNLTGVRSIIVAHNMESNIWRRYEENETNPIRKWYISIQRAKVERFEQACFNWSNGATAVSDIEAKEIAGLGVGYPVQTVENGVDTSYFRPQVTEVDPDALVFTGSMDWRPNQDAVEYFISEIYPLVKAQRPGLKFYVVGRKPPPTIRALGKVPGVTITGTVDDVRPYIAGAALYVVPLRIGGGSRLKILEAMAMKKPVLSTTIGAEGLEVTPDENILIADDSEGFASAIISSLNDPAQRKRFGENGYRLVANQYRWEMLGEKLERYLQTLTS